MILANKETRQMEIFCITVYIILALLSMYIAIQDLRGKR
jgi:hypothetical protein